MRESFALTCDYSVNSSGVLSRKMTKGQSTKVSKKHIPKYYCKNSYFQNFAKLLSNSLKALPLLAYHYHCPNIVRVIRCLPFLFK